MVSIDMIKDICTGCSACSNICANGSIEMKKNEFGFVFPSVNTDTCIKCNLCEKVCPVLHGNENLTDRMEKASYFAAWAKKEYMEPNATSGGIVSVLANDFIQGGVVFGASFVNNMRSVKHILCKTPDDLKTIAGSKYVQSDTTECYKEIKKLLKSGEKVLFIGTPCQVAGLRKFLGKKYDTLYTVDFLCHGVPSPLAWEKYVEHLEKKNRAGLIKYNFRAKSSGWGKIEQTAEFYPKRKFREVGEFNPYHIWFGKHLSIRSSCFHCKFRSDLRVSDITVADFWKIEKYYPEIPRKQGVSCVMINTRKGQELINGIVNKDRIVLQAVSYESIWEHRVTGRTNFAEPEDRKHFLDDLSELSSEKLLKKYPAPNYITLACEKIRSILATH